MILAIIMLEMEEEITEKDTKIQQLEQQVNTRVPYMIVALY